MAKTPIIVAVAPNGPGLLPTENPAVPIRPAELATDAALCMEAGASLLHLHVRGRDGGHTLEPEAYRAAIRSIRGAVGHRIVVQITTEACGTYSPLQQIETVRQVRPEACSLAIREFVTPQFPEQAFADFLAWCSRASVHCQFILYSADCLRSFEHLRRRGVIPFERCFVLIVAGNKAKRTSSRADLDWFLARSFGDLDWMTCGFGPGDWQVSTAAMANGGHVRVGFENNTRLPDGRMARRNDQLVTQAVRLSEGAARPLADADYLRRVMAQRI